MIPLRSSILLPRNLIPCSPCRGVGRLWVKNNKTKNCNKCDGVGLVPREKGDKVQKEAETNPLNTTVLISGSGITGPALGLSLRQRGIPCTIIDRDLTRNCRKGGYGLTLQQGMRTMRGLGFDIQMFGKASEGEGVHPGKDCVYSDRHLVMDSVGTVVGEWGMRKWVGSSGGTNNKHNIHVSRTGLRDMLVEEYEALGGGIVWGGQLESFKRSEGGEGTGENESGRRRNLEVKLKDGRVAHCDVLVGADGIRSTTRDALTGADDSLKYLDVFVMLGIFTPPPTGKCRGDDKDDNDNLMDGKTVFQVSDGSTRFYSMPYDASGRYMWQLSFPCSTLEQADGYKSKLKETAQTMCAGFKHVEEIIEVTNDEEISGYPVFDRDVVSDFRSGGEDFVTVIGDAAHPMSPFKGQGANQGLIDGLKLGRLLSGIVNWSDGDEIGDKLGEFERDMMVRAGNKCEKSREAARFLHTPVVLEEGDVTRGAMEETLKRKLE